MESIDTRSGAPASPFISRRSVVRAGATAAWSVPLIQVVGAAPAFAAVSGDTVLTLATPTGSYTSATTLHVVASVTNSGTHSTTNLQLTVSLPTPASGTVTATGWTVSGSGTSFVFTANAPVVASASLAIDVTFTVSSTPAGSLGVSASATNATTVAKSASVDAFTPSTTLQWQSFSGAYLASDATKLDVTTLVKNNGGASAKTLKIKLTLPVSSSGVAATPSGWTLTGSGTVWTFTRTADLGAGSTDGFTARFNVNSTVGGSVSGEASASNVTTAATSSSNVAGVAVLDLTGVSGTYVATDTTKMSVNATVSNTGGVDATGTTLKVTLPVSGSSPAVSGWSTTGTGLATVWTFTKTAALAASDSASFVAQFTVANGAGGDLKVEAAATNSGTTPSSTVKVEQANALLRITTLATTSSANRKDVTVAAAIQNIAVAGSKTASAIDLKVTMLRTAHPTAAVTPAADWQNNGGSSNIYHFTYLKPLRAWGQHRVELVCQYRLQRQLRSRNVRDHR